jgi:biotin operon repressor
MRPFSIAMAAGAFAAFVASSAFAQEVDWKKVDEAFGRSGAVGGDVHRYGFPRTDLQVTLDGVTIKPSLALGGWVALKPAHGGAMVMGDLVLLETEINPVMSKLIEGGLQITAVHNHLLRANPATFYMHVGGHGDPVKLATAIKSALAASKTPLGTPAAAAAPPAVDLDTAKLEPIIGVKGQNNGGVYAFGVPRRNEITMDVVMIDAEVNPVIKALRDNGIEVTALHSHMLVEQPRLFFMHFWANDDALKLARGLRAALDKTASKGAE